MSDFFPLVGAPQTKEDAQMVWPLRYSYWWAPRRALMIVSFGLVLLGILGFFVDWETTANVIYINTVKSLIVIPVGLFIYWVAEMWSSSWKRSVAGCLTLVYLALGMVGLVLGANEPDNLGFTHINRPWEAAIWIGLSVWTGITLWWPRRMFDYEWATGTSSGIRDSG